MLFFLCFFQLVYRSLGSFKQCSIAWMCSTHLPTLFFSLTFFCLSFHAMLFRCLYFLFFLFKRKINSYRYFDTNSGISWVYLGRQKICSQNRCMWIYVSTITRTHTQLTHAHLAPLFWQCTLPNSILLTAAWD